MFRSARLEALFGKRLDLITFADTLELIGKIAATEEADLDYKEQVHSKSDKEKTEFRKDVVAMGNGPGGILLIGIKEDSRAVPESVPKVDVSDAERRRLTDMLLHISPHLPVTIKPLEDPDDTGQGVLLVIVERSTLAPHALLDTQSNTHFKDGWIRYPIRNGPATRWMQESEVATRYRHRFTEARGTGERLDDIERDAFWSYISRYPLRTGFYPADKARDSLPVATIALTPELPGNLRISRETFSEFQHSIFRERIIGDGNGVIFDRTSVSTGKFVGSAGSPATVRYVELHADGSGVLMLNLEVFSNVSKGAIAVDPALCVTWLLSGLMILGRHARDRAGASGVASIRFRILADAGSPYSSPSNARVDESSLQIVDSRGRGYGRRIEGTLGVAESFVDNIADGGSDLISTISLLADQAFHAFGMPEVPLITAAGRIVAREWGNGQHEVIRWARERNLTE